MARRRALAMARRGGTPLRTPSSNRAQPAFPAALAWDRAVSAARSTASRPGPGRLARQAPSRRARVGEAGEAVVGSVVGRGLLGEAALGAVLHGPPEPAGPMAGQDGRHPDRHPAGGAVGALHLDLVDLRL